MRKCASVTKSSWSQHRGKRTLDWKRWLLWDQFSSYRSYFSPLLQSPVSHNTPSHISQSKLLWIREADLREEYRSLNKLLLLDVPWYLQSFYRDGLSRRGYRIRKAFHHSIWSTPTPSQTRISESNSFQNSKWKKEGTLCLAYLPIKSNAVTCNLNFSVLLNLPKQTPKLIRLTLGTETACLIMASLT